MPRGDNKYQYKIMLRLHTDRVQFAAGHYVNISLSINIHAPTTFAAGGWRMFIYKYKYTNDTWYLVLIFYFFLLLILHCAENTHLTLIPSKVFPVVSYNGNAEPKLIMPGKLWRGARRTPCLPGDCGGAFCVGFGESRQNHISYTR